MVLFKVATDEELSEITNEVSIFVGHFLKVKKSNEVSIMFEKLPVGTFSSSVSTMNWLLQLSGRQIISVIYLKQKKTF